MIITFRMSPEFPDHECEMKCEVWQRSPRRALIFLPINSPKQPKISWGLTSNTTLAILHLSYYSILYCAILPPHPGWGPQGTTGDHRRIQFSLPLPSAPLGVRLKSFALLRHVRKWGEACLKYPSLSISIP